MSACVSPSICVSLALAATAETSREGHTWCGRRIDLTGATTTLAPAGPEGHPRVVPFVLRRFWRTRAELLLLEVAGGSTLLSLEKRLFLSSDSSSRAVSLAIVNFWLSTVRFIDFMSSVKIEISATERGTWILGLLGGLQVGLDFCFC